jgi:tRNA pseudouridine55 synthase
MDGFLIINKEPFMTSFDVVHRIRKKFGFKKVGHAGTLDPQATGVLVLAIGKATKIISLYEKVDKEYAAKMTLGLRTDTQDSTGTVLSQSPWEQVSEAQVKEALFSFLGEIDQIPPMVSALKHKGKPLYKYARQGIEIERKSRRVTIFGVTDFSCSLPDVYFKVKCSKGTYIRTLCDDVGQKLGCGAVLSGLERTAVGPFSLADSVKCDEIEDISKVIIPLTQLMVNGEQACHPGRSEGSTDRRNNLGGSSLSSECQ